MDQEENKAKKFFSAALHGAKRVFLGVFSVLRKNPWYVLAAGSVAVGLIWMLCFRARSAPLAYFGACGWLLLAVILCIVQSIDSRKEAREKAQAALEALQSDDTKYIWLRYYDGVEHLEEVGENKGCFYLSLFPEQTDLKLLKCVARFRFFKEEYRALKKLCLGELVFTRKQLCALSGKTVVTAQTFYNAVKELPEYAGFVNGNEFSPYKDDAPLPAQNADPQTDSEQDKDRENTEE